METIRALSDLFTTTSRKFNRRYRCRFQEFVYRIVGPLPGLIRPPLSGMPIYHPAETAGSKAEETDVPNETQYKTTPSQRLPRDFFERSQSIKNVALLKTSRKTLPS